MNLRHVFIGEVPQKEEIAIVVIVIGGVTLMESHAVEIRINRMAHYLDFIKRYADIAIGGKHATEIGEVLLFGLLLIHNLIRQSNMVFLLLDNL